MSGWQSVQALSLDAAGVVAPPGSESEPFARHALGGSSRGGPVACWVGRLLRIGPLATLAQTILGPKRLAHGAMRVQHWRWRAAAMYRRQPVFGLVPECAVDEAWEAGSARKRCHSHYGRETVRSRVLIGRGAVRTCSPSLIREVDVRRHLDATAPRGTAHQQRERDKLWSWIVVEKGARGLKRLRDFGEGDEKCTTLPAAALLCCGAPKLKENHCRQKFGHSGTPRHPASFHPSDNGRGKGYTSPKRLYHVRCVHARGARAPLAAFRAQRHAFLLVAWRQTE